MQVLNIEIEKFLAKRSTRVFLAIYGLALIGFFGIYIWSAANLGASLVNAGQLPMASLKWLMGLLLPIMALYLSGSSFTEELASGTLQGMQLLPIPRQAIYYSKVVAASGIIGGMLLMQFVLSSILGGIVDGLWSLEALAVGLGAYMGAWLVLSLISGIGGTLAILVKSTGLTLVLGLFGFMAFGALGLYFPWLQKISLNALLGDYSNLISNFHWSQLFVLFAYYIMVSVVGVTALEK